MDEPLKSECWGILWAVQRSQRYHARRSAFFDRWNKLTSFAGVLGGTAVIAALGAKAPEWLAVAGGTAVAILSGVDLVAGTSEMARRHNDLRRRFCELEAEIARKAPQEVTAADVANWKSQRLTIESDEPPTYVALNILCDNELRRAYSHLENQPHKLNTLQRLTAHILIWENA